MTRLTDLAALGDAAGFQEEIESRLAARVADALEAKKVEVAQNYFAPRETQNEEVEALGEMTDAQMSKREDIVKGMKKSMAGFKKRYGARAKEVMYATATKRAME